MNLAGIALRTAKRAPMETRQHGKILSYGLDGNYFSTLNKVLKSDRQITALALPQWEDAGRELRTFIAWQFRRANLCITEHRFCQEDVGKRIFIGKRAQLLITGECDPCKRMEEVHTGLMQALSPSWRGGVTCRVIQPGDISVGDPVRIE